jgi:hypothetical protein
LSFTLLTNNLRQVEDSGAARAYPVFQSRGAEEAASASKENEP